MTVRNVWILNQARLQLCSRHKGMLDVGANLRNLIDAISDEKTCRKKPGAYNLNVRLLFAWISMNWPKRQHEEKPSFPVNCVERFVNMGQLLFAFFWVFLSFRETSSLVAPL